MIAIWKKKTSNVSSPECSGAGTEGGSRPASGYLDLPHWAGRTGDRGAVAVAQAAGCNREPPSGSISNTDINVVGHLLLLFDNILSMYGSGKIS